MVIRNRAMGCAYLITLGLLSLSRPGVAPAQQAPPTPDRPWIVSSAPPLQRDISAAISAQPALNATHPYSLAELIDFAEQHDPETQVSWELAKKSAAQLGVARSALYPTLAAVASASASQYLLFTGRFYREDVDLFPAALSLSYTVIDFGARSASIDLAKANLLSANFGFNDTHRKIIFEVSQAYYQLLDAMGQEQAAEATLQDASTLQQAVEDRLAHGLATLPDALEARAASAQAQYELTSVQGQEQIARGVLATILSVDPTRPFRIQDVSAEATAQALNEPVQSVIQRALSHRPDLMALAEQVQVGEAQVKQARSAYFPAISLQAQAGRSYNLGQQIDDPTVNTYSSPYQVQVQFRWTLFDGEAHHNELLHAEADRRRARAQLASLVAQIQREVWISYANLQTSQQQLQAANALLQASLTAYSAASEAYRDGVRTFVDVTSAQRDLARARSAQIGARTQVLTDAADLAFRAGNLAQASVPIELP